MKTKEERQREIDIYIASRMEPIFYDRTMETMKYFVANKEKILQSLLFAITKAGEAMKPFIDSGEKQKVKYLQFSYLFSAAKMKKLKLKLDLYDARHYGDLSSHGGYWSYDELFPYIDEDMQILRDELASKSLRIDDYKVSEIRLEYHVGVFQMMWAILMELGDEEAFAAALSDVFEPTVKVIFGAYLDQSEVVATIHRKEAS